MVVKVDRSNTGSNAQRPEMERAVISIIETLHGKLEPFAPSDLIGELERAGFRNTDIRTAIWHLLDRHRIQLTRDLRLALPRSVV